MFGKNIMMKKYYLFRISFLVFALFLVSSCKGESNSENKTENFKQKTKAEKIEEIVSLYSEYGGFNGAVLVSDKGKVIFKKGFGLAILEWDIPNQTDTKFRIASITKPFTALLIMQMVAEGKLDLHVPISTYLPDYPKNNGDQITIHYLLTHTSGTVRDYESELPINKYPDRYRLEELIKQYASLPLEFTPGEKFDYSNAGYLTLAYVIETVSGKSYETALQENILDPIGMKNTGIDKHRTIIKNRAYGHFKGFGDYFNDDFGDMSAIMGVGNIYSTVEDMFLLDQTLYTEKLLPKKYMDLVFTKHVSDPDYGGYYGYGWEVKEKSIGNTSEKIETIGHSGSMRGFTALFTRIPSSNSSIVFFNNTGGAFLNAMTTAIIGILNDQPYDFPKIPLAMFMKKTIGKEGIQKGILFYKEHKGLHDYHVSEQELIVAGYKYLQAGNAEYAAEIFKLSIEVFPDRDNPYDSYAEALMTLGKNKEAIKNYKKSLKLNPNNNNAKEMLKKLELKSN